MIHRSDTELRLDHIVFEQRNKAYGAFNLRQSYNAHVKSAFLIMSVFCIGLFIFNHLAMNKSAIKDKEQPIVCNFPDREIEISTALFDEKPKFKNHPKPIALAENTAARSVNNSFEISNDLKTPETNATGPLIADNTVDGEGVAIDSSGNDEGMSGNEGSGGTDPAMDDRPDLRTADVMPAFPGGERALSAYVLKNLKFPFIDEQVSGKVFVQFTVAADGRVTDIQLMKGIHPEFDDEAMRVISKMPQWIPGKYHGRSVAVKKVIPIHFRID